MSAFLPNKTTLNTLLLVLIPSPSRAALQYLRRHCSDARYGDLHQTWAEPLKNLLSLAPYCRLEHQHPIAVVNLLFFLNVNVLFWLISQLQGSTWLIDPYWTILPLLIGHYYHSHPAAAAATSARATIAMTLLWVWALRLTHSYFRREKWAVGEREDWRFAEMRRQWGRHWWWLSFWAVYASQQAMLVGLTLPLYSVHFKGGPWHPVRDTLATMLCLIGLLIANAADTQLWRFTQLNEARQAAGKPQQLLLDQGLWRFSRHPSYFGEQLWWWGLALFAVNAGETWVLVGPLFNSICMAKVTQMVEQRMVLRADRAEAFRDYQRKTSVLVPWFVRVQQ